MKSIPRWLLLLPGSAVLIFGLLCLNYTKADGLERHREVARRRGLPEPGAAIFYGGVASVVLGSGIVGYGLGRGRRSGAMRVGQHAEA